MTRQFARTRENNAEFGAAGSAGKLLRDALRAFMLNATDSLVVSRIAKIMHDELKLDTTSARGLRKPANGITLPAGRLLLKGFNFNANTLLSGILSKQFTINPTTGAMSITGLVPAIDVKFPQGASQITISGVMANINFATGVSDVRQTNVQNMPINSTSTAVTLTPTALPIGTGIRLYLVKIEFFQLLNATQYALKDGSFNAFFLP